MFNGKLGKMISMGALTLTLGLGGCMTMPDGTSEPDYVMIEFGSVAAFTVIVNETKVPDESVVKAYEGLSAMETSLQAVIDGSGDVDLSMIDSMFAAALPIEYQALGMTGSKLIRSRVALYAGDSLPDMLPESELTAKISLSVVQGAKAALAPKYHALRP